MLREITARNRFGWRPSDLAVRCGLDRGTTHRILACLVRERLVQQRPRDRHYVPGPLLFEMGLSLPAHSAFRLACQPFVDRIARRAHGYALLCVRSGSETVCVANAGTPAYRGTAFEVGTRRPLTATAAGVAILIAMPRSDAQAIVTRQLRDMPPHGEPNRDALRRMWQRSLASGFGVNNGFTARGVNAVAVPLFDGNGAAFGSLAVASVAARLPAARLAETAALLGDEASTVAALAREMLPEGAYNLMAGIASPTDVQ